MAPAFTLITSTTNATADSRRGKSKAIPTYVRRFSTGGAIAPVLQLGSGAPFGQNIEITASATAGMRLYPIWDKVASNGLEHVMARETGEETPAVESVLLSQHARVTLDELVALDGCSASEVLTRAIEEYWDRRLFETGNAAYAELRQDPVAWDAYQAECAAWAGTLMDGLARTARSSRSGGE